MSGEQVTSHEGLSVAEVKRHFSEVIDRVQRGERVLVTRRGRPVVLLTPPEGADRGGGRPPPVGLAAVAGALADVDDLESMVREIYAARRRARDRRPPDLG